MIFAYALDSNTIIYGFNINMPPAIKQLAARNKVQIRMFNVIYKLLDDARESMEDDVGSRSCRNRNWRT